ncbi:hypothetical protein AZF37_07235 [endosymbiont 'TC1' of Trimyema compressum]|nr:hypothetical protein AZF37_07235 [endosymbiont 'TC1' of Trimyema compressum]
MLVKYDGETLTYDEIGNVLVFGNKEHIRKQGRRLASFKQDNQSTVYNYDADGIRTSKKVDSEVTEYATSNGEVVGQKTNNSIIIFNRGYTGDLISMVKDGDTYHYKLNAQNDVEGILDNNGKEVVSYVYDSWGNIKEISGELKDTIGIENPLRYRSYFYDEESGYYYLQQRYYNPEIGRFINGDVYVNTGEGAFDSNMFAYCGNNPINNIDREGKFFNWLGQMIEKWWLSIWKLPPNEYQKPASVSNKIDVRTSGTTYDPISFDCYGTATGRQTRYDLNKTGKSFINSIEDDIGSSNISLQDDLAKLKNLILVYIIKLLQKEMSIDIILLSKLTVFGIVKVVLGI